MAAFCKQCSIEMFGEDFREFAGNGDCIELCETCGWVLVNNDGECIDPDCIEHGNSDGAVRKREADRVAMENEDEVIDLSDWSFDDTL